MQLATLRFVPSLSYAGNEAINTLYTNLTFLGEDKKTIMFTSCHANEGKSFMSYYIALTMASMGKNVALVDLDLRKSQMAKTYLRLDTEFSYGTSHYLAGMASINDVVYQTDKQRFYVVPCTRTVSNSLPLVGSARMKVLFDTLEEQMDYVIVDAPPVGILVDAAKIATFCDGVVMVIGYNTVRSRELVEAVQQVEQSGCPVLGTIINQADFDDYTGRKYYTSYYNKYYSKYYEAS